MISMERSVLAGLLTALTGVGGDLNGAKVGLYKVDTPLTPDLTLADLTEADFTGYALSAAVTWGTVGYDPSNVPEVFAGLTNFVAGSPVTVANVVYGYFVVDGGGTNLLYAERFTTPVNVINAGQILGVIPRVQAGQFVS